MRPTLILFVQVATFAVLVNSVIRFGLSGMRDKNGGGMKLLAAFSSLVTLLGLIALYADAVRQTAMQAVRSWTSNEGFIDSFRTVVVGADRFARDLVNSVNPGADVAYRPDRSLWPFAVVVAAFLVRWLIYVALERRQLSDAAATGSVYWSHITAYAMTVAFFILIAGWNPMVVILGSLVLIGAFLVFLTGLFEDLALLVRRAARIVVLYAKGLGRRVAQLCVAFAGVIRLVFERAHYLYITHIRKPLRRVTERAVTAAESFDNSAKDDLTEENRRHRARFHRQEDAPDVPESGHVLD